MFKKSSCYLNFTHLHFHASIGRFVSCLAFVCTHECPQGFLVSGSGDSTVRLWDISSGSLLDTCNIREKAGLLESKEIEDRYAAVTDLCTIPDSTLVGVAVQRQVPIHWIFCLFFSTVILCL
ncbi:hypothetical protein L3X38_045114 [Prunus dulcis]|uniref:Transducin/WD40 repeat-like superfamily protein n=1 Tax=Prunus dulcis TaxID=3755 RepID=A0AAD4YPL0_PRUDU|nr:hypothetical protein L3X38_045114 [Prunus dulcis]